ncbi:MAG: hypothetical protein ACD_39C02007G0002 [uncultured bacterium]|nr:MAG: hypothetical protein ACD_39C02007G0002 [uncultured bacterium]
MISFLIPVVLIAVLFAAAVFLLKILMPPKEEDNQVHIKQAGVGSSANMPAVAPVQPEPGYYYEPRPERMRSRHGPSLMPLIVLAAIGYLVYTNQDLIAEKMPAAVTDIVKEKPKEAISLAEVEGHAIVDGVNWIKIVATSSTGIPFTGWVSELAIQKEPPKENPMSDEFMKKLGLPTQKERLEGAKRLRKVGESLDTALKEFRSKNE